MTENNLKVCCVQMEIRSSESYEQRRRRAGDLIRQTKADLVLLPEMWLCGFSNYDRYEESAEELDGPTVRMLSEVAAEKQCYLYGGSIVTRQEGKLYNTALMFGPDGTLLTYYNKMHVFGYESRESELLTPGNRVVLADLEDCRAGITICYDLRFPEQYRAMADRGAPVYLVCADWPKDQLNHWRLFNQVRAAENQCFLVACNRARRSDLPRQTSHAGHSMIVDPSGKILAEAGECQELLYGSFDVNQVYKVRERAPFLTDRGPEDD